MPEKRKDPKGRVLRDGETYRKDGRYMYRYTNIIKSLPYLMGHSDVDTTLNIYTHSSYETAAQAFGKVESAKDKGVEQVEA